MGKKPTYEELEQRVKELAQEVVKHKQAEEKLWESEGRFSGMFEHMSSGVAVYESVDNGEDFVFRAFNSAAERITRISRSEALGNRLLDLFPHMDKSGLLGALQRVWETGQEEHLPPFYYKDEIREGWRENRIYKLPTGEVVALFDDVTERKQAEEALRKSEERYRSLFQNTPIGISIVDNEGNILDFNDAMLRLHGYSREDRLAIGRTSEYYYNPEDREKVTAQLLKNGFVNEMEVKFKRKDGTPYDALLSMLPIEIDGKSLWHAMIQDITERKQAEEALRESEEKYRNIFNNAQVGIFRTRISDGKILDCNDRFARTYGYKTSEECIDDFVVSEHYTAPGSREKMVASLMEKGEVNNIEACFSRKDGDDVWIRFSAHAYPEEGYLEGVGYDITEEKEALEALQESEEKYRQLSDLLPQVVFETDEKGNLTFTNHMAFDLFGYTRADFEKGLNALQMLMPEDRDRALKNIQKVLKGEKLGGTEYTALTKDGRTYPVMIYSNPVISEGKPAGLRGIMADLTEVKRAQEALLENEEKLTRSRRMTGNRGRSCRTCLTYLVGS